MASMGSGLCPVSSVDSSDSSRVAQKARADEWNGAISIPNKDTILPAVGVYFRIDVPLTVLIFGLRVLVLFLLCLDGRLLFRLEY